MEAMAEDENIREPETSPVTGNPLAQCLECEFSSHWLGDHIVATHGLSHAAYRAKHPGASLSSQDTDVLVQADLPTPAVTQTVTRVLGAVPFPMRTNVPVSDCLSMPEAYRLPQHGQLALEVEDALLALADPNCRSVNIFGKGGSGKDALIHYVSASTRWPAMKKTIHPTADIQAWFYSRTFDQNHAYWEEGPVLKAMRDGYQPPDGGPRIPYLILITDGDRATPKQAEHLRLPLDTIEPRVPGPLGETFPMFPGTVIVITSNTNGSGDTTGRYVSARPQDATIIERLDATFEFPWLAWEDEVEVVKAKFPLFVRSCMAAEVEVNNTTKTVDMLAEVGKVTSLIRAEIHGKKLFTDFSHRHVCSWLKHAERRIRHEGRVTTDLLPRSAKVWLTRIGDEHTKMKVEKLMDSKITGSMLARKGRGP